VEQADYAESSPRGNSLGRMVDAQEVAYVVAFMASEKAWAITGDQIVANGGAGKSVYY
jgi:enoyl-[acyl-carrier-protein] reductase (NADH)